MDEVHVWGAIIVLLLDHQLDISLTLPLLVLHVKTSVHDGNTWGSCSSSSVMNIDLAFLIVDQPVESLSCFNKTSALSFLIVDADWNVIDMSDVVLLVRIFNHLHVHLSFVHFSSILKVNYSFTT